MNEYNDWLANPWWNVNVGRLIYKGENLHRHQELLWDRTDEIDCAETEAVGLLSSRSPLIAFGFPLNLSIASWQMSSNQSSSRSTLTAKMISQIQNAKCYMIHWQQDMSKCACLPLHYMQSSYFPKLSRRFKIVISNYWKNTHNMNA